MDGISGIGPIGHQQNMVQPANLTPAQGAPVQKGAGESQGLIAGSSGSILSAQSLSITAGSESLVMANGGVPGDNQMLGALVLLLTLEYLQSDDEEEKKGLLGLITSLVQMQQQQQQAGGGGSVLAYNSSFVNIEMAQMTAISNESFLHAYTGQGNGGGGMLPGSIQPVSGAGFDTSA